MTINLDNSKILIVDDIPANVKILGKLMQNNGFTVFVATSGESAVSTAKKVLPDLILMDLNMPDMDGIEAVKQIKSNLNERDIPIIFTTAVDDSDKIIEGFEAGAADYVVKPFNHSELIQRIKTHLKTKKFQDAIILSRIELEKLNQNKDRFFNIISHDIKSPLSAVYNLSKNLSENFDKIEDSDKQEIADSISSSVEKQLHLISNLLDWSRIQSGKFEPKFERIYIYQIIDMVAELYQEKAQEKNIKIEIDISKEHVVKADRFMFETVVRNLLSNSIKFSSQNGKIKVGSSDNGDSISCFIQDYGIGIPLMEQHKLFSVEGMISIKENHGEKGTGLGLVLCKDFVKLMDGILVLDSVEGEGSTFTFTLPK